MKKITIAEMKRQLERISEEVSEQFILIGGLAVNQYVVKRKSHDIDLICNYEKAIQIIDKVYPTTEWIHSETNENEYRPSYKIKHKIYDDYPVVKFGPKIIERGGYNYLNWDMLSTNTLKFKYQNKTLENILIPTMEALCYTKIVSFLGRDKENKNKLRQDLRDIKELTNLDDFRFNNFLNLIKKNKFEEQITSKFHIRLSYLNESLHNSNFGELITLFHNANINIKQENLIKMNQIISDDNKALKNKNIKLVAFDLDGTLIKGIRHSWTTVWNILKINNQEQKNRKKQFREKKLSYIKWCELDANDFIKKNLQRKHFSQIKESKMCSVTKNLREAIIKLKQQGIRTAIISGGIDTLLYTMIPDANELFDDILINKFIFDKTDKFISISPTEYDWDDTKIGVVGKKRGLERICEKYSINLKDTAFVGDDVNDFQAMHEAKLKILYTKEGRELENIPHKISMITDNNLMKVVDKILNPILTEEQVD